MFYERFLALCRTHGKTPSAVMAEIGMNRASASFWKKGAMPSSTNLKKLAGYFNVPAGYLLGNDGPATDASVAQDTHATIEDAGIEEARIRLDALVDYVDAIPKENRTEAIREIAAFAEFTLHKYGADIE